MKARKKPITVEVVQWTGDNWSEVNDFINKPIWWLKDGSLVNKNNPIQPIVIKTLEGNMQADINDYIIKGVNGEFYPCKPDIFDKTYDIVVESAGRTMKHMIEIEKNEFIKKDAIHGIWVETEAVTVSCGRNIHGYLKIKSYGKEIYSKRYPNPETAEKRLKEIIYSMTEG